MCQTNPSDRWITAAPPIPVFRPAASKEKWSAQREDIRAHLWSLLGRLPPRPKIPEVRTLSRENRGDYVFEKFQFDNQAGATVPGYLFLPKGINGRVPGILYGHWHGGEYSVGKEEMLQAKHTPEEPGPTLARRGFAVLGIDAWCFGERNGQGPGGPGEQGGGGEITASKFNLWFGRTLWGMMVRDDLMALDYLASRPEVDPERLGATGISMGATRTWWLMALDDRLKAGSAVACLTRYEDLIRTEALKAHGIYYFVPGFLNHFDTEAVIALIAPRPMLFMTGDQDAGSPPEGIRKIDAAVRPVYALYGQESAFENVVYPGLGHVYTSEMWKKTLQHLERLKTR